MEKFIPCEKLPKKEKRKIDQARRQTWGELNPITRKPENSRAYNRNKARNWKHEDHKPIPGLFCLLVTGNKGTAAKRNFYLAANLHTSQVRQLVVFTQNQFFAVETHIKHRSVPRAVPGITVSHEMVGVVEEVGSAATSVRLGDRVTVNVETFCDKCFFCQHGFVNNYPSH